MLKEERLENLEETGCWVGGTQVSSEEFFNSLKLDNIRKDREYYKMTGAMNIRFIDQDGEPYVFDVARWNGFDISQYINKTV